MTINEIQVAIDPIIEPNTEGLVLDISGEKTRPGLVMLGNTGHCC
ncbi:hypothetical protein RCG23_07115 [Neobacillus sp. PS3-34]|nr:hypothetical protein [Neobacillus sp. PS3-34]WML49713.1 hypothetical protein RCG23_07115 [Neobacillus sp. PS3-34]